MAGYSIDKVFFEARESARRSKINFNAIIEKYSKEFANDDTVDVYEQEIISDKGSIRKQARKSFGTSRLKTTKRKEESQAGFISGSESDCSQSQTTRYDVKEEHFDETNPEIWQDLVNSFVQDPGNEPSDAETISSSSSSSSKITDDEGSLSDEVYDEDDERCSSPLFFTPIIIKEEPGLKDLNPYNDGWYSLSKFNNYNPREANPSNNVNSCCSTHSKSSPCLPEVICDEGINYSSSKPGFEYACINKTFTSSVTPTKKKVPFNTLELYQPEDVNKTYTKVPAGSYHASVSSSNDVTIVPTTEDSSDCYIVLSDTSMSASANHSQTNLPKPFSNNDVAECNDGISIDPLNKTSQAPQNPLTPRRKLKPKKLKIPPQRVRTFSNDDLQMFFMSNDPAVAEKILSPPDLLQSNKVQIDLSGSESCVAVSFDPPKTPNVNHNKETKSLSLMALINQMRSKSKDSPDTEDLLSKSKPVEKPAECNTPLLNLGLSPTSHLATLRLNESPNEKIKMQSTSADNTYKLCRRQQKDRSGGTINDIQRKSQSFCNANIPKDYNSNNSYFQNSEETVKPDSRKSAPPLTCENLRIFNTLHSKPCDLLLSPKRCSSARSQSSTCIMVVSPEKSALNCPKQKDLVNSTVDLTKSPRRPASCQPLLRRFSETSASSNGIIDLTQSQMLQPLVPNSGSKPGVQEKALFNLVNLSVNKQAINSAPVQNKFVKEPHIQTANFENLFQKLSTNQQYTKNAYPSRQSSEANKSKSLSQKTKSTPCPLIKEILNKNRTESTITDNTSSKESQTKSSDEFKNSKSGHTDPLQKQIPKHLSVHRKVLHQTQNQSKAHLNIPFKELSMQKHTPSVSSHLTSIRSVSSDSSTINMHMPVSDDLVFLNGLDNQIMQEEIQKKSVKKPTVKDPKELKNGTSKRRQSKSLDFDEAPNDLDNSPTKERRMNGQQFHGSQNGFVIPQASNIIKPVPKSSTPTASHCRRRVPSKSLDTPSVNQGNDSIYDWQSDCSQNSGHIPRPLPKFFGLPSSNTVSPQPVNLCFGTSTPRKNNVLNGPYVSILNDSVSTIASEIPDFADLHN